MKRWWQLLALAAFAVVSLVVTGVASTASSGSAPSLAPASAERGDYRGRGALYFAVSCGFSHRNQDDPIVFPRQPRRSHDHTFFANTSTDALSTPASLRAAGTTCGLRFDTAAYWVPTLFVGGQPVRPVGVTAYYVRRTVDSVQAFPPGLKIIAGNAAAQSPQSRQVTAWSCGSLRNVTSSVPTCGSGFGFGLGRRSGLSLLVNFPSCWDGRNLDSANHQSHMAYATDGVCPASHSVEVPGLLLVVRYPVSGGGNAELSSGGQFSGHGDFVNAWNQDVLERLVDRYLNRFR